MVSSAQPAAQIGHNSKIVPRWYQTAARDAVFENWADNPGSAQIIVAPTGSGKTILLSIIAERFLSENPHGYVMSLAHVPELVEQGYTAFRDVAPHVSAGVFAAKLGRKDRFAKVTFGLVQSVARAIDLFKKRIGLIIVDECHLISHRDDGQYRDVIRAFREARGRENVRIVGLTATPYRLDSGNLLEPYKDQAPLFEEIAYEVDMLDLIEEGSLSRVVSTGTKVDLAGAVKAAEKSGSLHRRGGEFIDGELDAAVNTEEINRAACKEIVETGLAQDRKSWLVFAVTIDHATRLRDIIREHGVSCEMVCGETPTAERRRIINDFKSFKIKCLTSVNVLSTGFDHKAVDLVAMLRPTQSPGLYLQQAGRGLRVYPGKDNALLLDFAGNVMRHGLLTNVKGVSKRSTKKEDEEPKAKICPSCSSHVDIGVKLCPACGFAWQAPQQQNREEKLFKANVAEKVMEDPSGWGEVLSANFQHKVGANGLPSLRLNYVIKSADGQTQQCSETLCFEHPPDSWPHKSARLKWRERTGLRPPDTVAEAVARIGELRRPRLVRTALSDCGKWLNVRSVKL